MYFSSFGWFVLAFYIVYFWTNEQIMYVDASMTRENKQANTLSLWLANNRQYNLG